MKSRKIINIILILIIVFSLSSCTSRVPFITRTYNTTSITLIDNIEDIKDETYILYSYSNKCSTCNLILDNLNRFISTESIKIYGIESNDEINIKIINGSKSVKTISKENILTKYERLSYELKNTLKIKNIYYVNNIDDLKDIIKKDSIVYYSLNNCIDCQKFEDLFFNEFLLNTEKTIYGFDVSIVDNNYQEFKDEIGLSNKNNELGYKNGFVPTLIKYSNNKVTGYKVIFNDEFYINPETNKIKIINSYYSNNPYLNKEFNNMDKYYKTLIKFYSNESKLLINE